MVSTETLRYRFPYYLYTRYSCSKIIITFHKQTVVMPRYQAISHYSHMTPRRRRRMKSAFLNTHKQECKINETTINDPGSVSVRVPVNLIHELTEAGNNDAVVADVSNLSSGNEGIINNNDNQFGDQASNPCSDLSIESSNINNTIDQYSRFVYCEENKTTLISDLRQCFLEENICHSAATRILQILSKHNIDDSLPKDIRTLLGTPRNVTLYDVSPGKYVHFGLKVCLEHSLDSYFSHNIVPKELCLNFNIDGLPIAKSSCSQFWPILGSIVQANSYTEPFVIGIYHGDTKPKSNNEFLKLFIDELKDLLDFGLLYKNRHVIINIGAFICDAPPFHSIDSVKEFDKQLNDEDQKKKLTEYFRSIGGLSAKDLHTRAMTKLFTNSLAMTCSWKGFKQNHKIEGLMIMQCLYDAISAEYPTTLKEFEILTRDWLRHAKQRNARMAP